MSDPRWIYTGTDQLTDPDRVQAWLADPPPWRKRAPTFTVDRIATMRENDETRGKTYVCSGDAELKHVNLALMLRRPLLVTGDPGLGKSSLAYGIAWALGLGSPLRWEINSQTTLRDGLYTYDAVGHFNDPRSSIAEYIRLGPLGTALLPTPLPRVLLVDELDKSSYDLANDLLHVFEEGTFSIDPLVNSPGTSRVMPCDGTSNADRVEVHQTRVSTVHHPVVVITSNGERDFPAAFKRRCISFEMQPLGEETLARVVANQLGASIPAETLTSLANLPTDQVLQTLFAQKALGIARTDLDTILGKR